MPAKVEAFFHENSNTICYVVSDPATARAAIVDSCLDFDMAAGRTATTHADSVLAYVAAGRLLGYIEDHMNSWDCFAALLMISEAGGEHAPLDAETALEQGTRLVAGGPGVYPQLVQIAADVYGA